MCIRDSSSVVSSSVTALGGDPDKFTAMLTKWTCIPHMVGGLFIIFIGLCVLCKVFGKNHSFKDALKALPFCILTGVVVGVLYLTCLLYTSHSCRLSVTIRSQKTIDMTLINLKGQIVYCGKFTVTFC